MRDEATSGGERSEAAEAAAAVTRRQVLAAAIGTTALAAVGCAPGAASTAAPVASAPAGAGLGAGPSEATGGAPARGARAGARMPVVYLPHGGGPWPFVELGFGTAAENDALRRYLESVGSVGGARPRALLVVSAHWEERVPTVMTAARPPMLYDYYGFPPEAYEITWPAPGAPDVAARVRELLGAAGLESAEDGTRGFDHGTFVPLKLAFPAADVPATQLSLVRGLDPSVHLALGRALAPLRDEGVLIVGSGMSYHNMRGFMRRESGPASVEFDRWLAAETMADPERRDASLAAWTRAPSARAVHPREEHLLPLMVVAGAAGADRAQHAYAQTYAGVALSAFHFG